VISAEYEVTLIEAIDRSDLKQRATKLLASPSLPRQRRSRTYDLRPLIEKLEIISENKIFIRLSAREAATGRPEEVLDVLGIPTENTQTERVGLIFQG
jgi:predicted ATP-grasp superfamily ATP-dependent carboligase